MNLSPGVGSGAARANSGGIGPQAGRHENHTARDQSPQQRLHAGARRRRGRFSFCDAVAARASRAACSPGAVNA